MDIKNTTDPKYYNWLLYAVGDHSYYLAGLSLPKEAAYRY